MAAPSLSFRRDVFAKLSPHPYLVANLTDQPSPSPSSTPTRTNGRAPQQARPLQINTSSLSHAHGSALVRAGNTTVLCGVRAEILPVANIPQYRPREYATDEKADGGEGDEEDDGREQELGAREISDYDLVVPNMELATGCAPQFLPGVPPTQLAQTMSVRLSSLLQRCRLVRAADLRIWHDEPAATAGGKSAAGEDAAMAGTSEQAREGGGDDGDEHSAGPKLVAYWVLYIDLLFVSWDGNGFDAAVAAAVAALRDTRLPKARWDADREAVVCTGAGPSSSSSSSPSSSSSSSSPSQTRPLRVRGLPVACTAAVFLEKENTDFAGASTSATAAGKGTNSSTGTSGRHWLLLDPDRLEESMCKETVTMVVDCSGGAQGGAEPRIRSIEKHGGTVLGRELLRGFAQVAAHRWEEVKEAMGT